METFKAIGMGKKLMQKGMALLICIVFATVLKLMELKKRQPQEIIEQRLERIEILFKRAPQEQQIFDDEN